MNVEMVQVGAGNGVGVKEGKSETLLANDALSEYEEQMNELNAQIAMNQYLMMKQMEYVDENEDMPELKTLMLEQMERIKCMIDMSVPYDASIFYKFNQEWQQRTDKDYKPPLPSTKEEDEEKEEEDDNPDIVESESESIQPHERETSVQV